MSGIGGIITGGLGVNNQSQEAASSDLILAPFRLYLDMEGIIISPTPPTITPTPTPTPTPEAVVGGGGVATRHDDDDERELLKVKFRVEIKGKVKTQSINIDVDRLKGHVDIMKKLKNYSWKPKKTESLKSWK